MLDTIIEWGPQWYFDHNMPQDYVERTLQSVESLQTHGPLGVRVSHISAKRSPVAEQGQESAEWKQQKVVTILQCYTLL